VGLSFLAKPTLKRVKPTVLQFLSGLFQLECSLIGVNENGDRFYFYLTIFCAMVEQQVKNAVAVSLFWVAFLK